MLNEFGGNTCLSLFLLKKKKGGSKAGVHSLLQQKFFHYKNCCSNVIKKSVVFSLLFGVFCCEFSWTYDDNYWIEHSF